MKLIKYNRHSGKKGFTLIELLVTISILAILAAIGVVSYQTANQKARNSKRQADLEQVRAALEIYRADNSGYPAGAINGDLATISGIGQYITTGSIVDPKNSSTYIYKYVPVGITYSLEAVLEPDEDPYILYGP